MSPRALPACCIHRLLEARRMRTVVVLEGDQTGQELLEEALRAMHPDVTGVTLSF